MCPTGTSATSWLSLASALVLCASGCGRPSPPKAGDGDASGASGPGAAKACEPQALGLGDAKPVALWKAPEGCTPRLGGSGPVVVHNEAELGAYYTCPAGAPMGVDFKTHALVLSSRMLSPAGVGTTIVDDGAKVTFISRQRKNCPNDPRPMPMSVVHAFLLPAGAARSFGDATCTIESTCN